MAQKGDLITLVEAQKHFHIGRATLFRLLEGKQLTRYGRTGDRTIYILRKELKALRTIRRGGR